jgi:hypothetical protein
MTGASTLRFRRGYFMGQNERCWSLKMATLLGSVRGDLNCLLEPHWRDLMDGSEEPRNLCSVAAKS